MKTMLDAIIIITLGVTIALSLAGCEWLAQPAFPGNSSGAYVPPPLYAPTETIIVKTVPCVPGLC